MRTETDPGSKVVVTAEIAARAKANNRRSAVSRALRLIAAILPGLVVPGFARAADLFSAQRTSALTNQSFVWQVADARGGLEVRFSSPGGTHSVVVTGAEADVLRKKVASLQLGQADIDSLRSLPAVRQRDRNGQEVAILRPFDGVTYQFTVCGPGGIRRFSIVNPLFDVEYHPQLKECIRLKEALAFIEFLERLAKGEE